MTFEPLDLPALLSSIMWPLIAIIIFIFLRAPLTAFITTLLQRIQKISFGGLSLDLAAMTEMKPVTLDSEIRQLTAAPTMQSGTSNLEAFIVELRGGAKQDFIVIDLGSEANPRWLSSRLYILAFLISCFDLPIRLVFTETAGPIRGRFIGTASADHVRWALARRYSWLEMATHSAFVSLQELQFDPKTGFLNDFQTSYFMQQFFNLIRVSSAPAAPPDYPPGKDTNEWVDLPNGLLEHAKWLDGAGLERLLGGDLATSQVVLLPNKALRDLTDPVLLQSGEFVAVVDQDHKFLSLIGRTMILESLANEFTKQVRKRDA